MKQAMIGVLLTAAVTGCSRGASQTVDTNPPVAVRLADVVTEEAARPVRGTGMVGPREEVALAFKIGGVIRSVEADAGDVVSAGAVLAVLDLSEIDAAVARAQSALAKAQRDVERARRLHADSVVTLSQLQDAETAAEIARANAEEARFNHRLATIVAPSAGVILRRSAQPGELVSPGATVLTLGSRARGTVLRAGLSDREVVRVSRGDAARVTFAALPDRVFAGTVIEIGAAAQPGTGTYEVVIALAGGAGLAAGLIGDMEIRPSQPAPAQLIPLGALLEADGMRGTVYVPSADGTRAERRKVTLSFIDGDRVAVLSGLEDVRRVIVEGAAWLRDGSAVRVVP